MTTLTTWVTRVTGTTIVTEDIWPIEEKMAREGKKENLDVKNVKDEADVHHEQNKEKAREKIC